MREDRRRPTVCPAFNVLFCFAQRNTLISVHSCAFHVLPCIALALLPKQGLMGGKEGAVLRCVEKVGSGADDTTWRVLFKQGDNKFIPCGQTKRRPQPDDLVRCSLVEDCLTGGCTSSLVALFVQGEKPQG